MIANAPHPHIYQKILFNDPSQRAAAQYIRLFRSAESDALVARAQSLSIRPIVACSIVAVGQNPYAL